MSRSATIAKFTALILLSIIIVAGYSLSKTPDMTSRGTQIVFRYGVGAKNVLDTYANTYTKDLIGDPPITIKMVLTDEELVRIEAELDEVEFFSKSDWDLVPHGSVSGQKTPFSTYYLKVSYQGVTREIRWNDSNLLPEDFKGPAVEIAKLLWSIIEAKPEYKILPQARGAYA